MRASERVLVIKKTDKTNLNNANCKWDRYLDDYNNYVKEYNMHYLNAQKGDERSLSLYPYMQEKEEELKKRIVRAYNNNRLSEGQIKRVIEINMKIITACIN